MLLMFTFDGKLWLPIAETERVKFITQIKTVLSTISCVCVCGMPFRLREVKWLNYRTETICNNWYIVQRTLLISEYSKHTHFKAKSEHKTKSYNWATYDVMIDRMDMIFCQLEMFIAVHVNIEFL